MQTYPKLRHLSWKSQSFSETTQTEPGSSPDPEGSSPPASPNHHFHQAC